MRNKIFMIILLTVILNLFTVGSVYGVTEKVTVTIPTFKIKINEQEILGVSDYRKYPFILYKGITYIPMTYYNCSLLGLSSSWDSQSGLVISKREFDKMGVYSPQKTTIANKVTQTAFISDIKITINGKTINNAEEEYPFLSFRDVIYLPLTWRFAVDEFGWRYNFDDTNGLVITADSKFIIKGQAMYYIKDDVVIYVDTSRNGLSGPASNNLYITLNGTTKRLGSNNDYFGYEYTEDAGWTTSTYLDYKDEWIYVNYSNIWSSGKVMKCKINVKTGEIIEL